VLESEFQKKNALFGLMAANGYSIADLSTAFPGESEAEVFQRLQDNALATRRTVLRFGILGTRSCSSRYFNIAQDGRRLLGDATETSPARNQIHCYGGSTTIGFNVGDGETWPAALQRSLRAFSKSVLDWTVLNFGAGNHTSLQASLRLLGNCMNNLAPNIAIFYGGFNDAFYSWGDTDGVIPFLDKCLGLSQHNPGREVSVGEVAELIPRLDAGTMQRWDEVYGSSTAAAVYTMKTNREMAVHIQEACTKLWGVKVLRYFEPTPFMFGRPDQDLLPRIRESNKRMLFVDRVLSEFHSSGALGGPVDRTRDLTECGQALLDGPLWIDEAHATPFLNEHIGRRIAEDVKALLELTTRQQSPASERRQDDNQRLVSGLPSDQSSDMYPLW
jgi:hypothetical protein